MPDEKIEAAIITCVSDAAKRNEFATRAGVIKEVTGILPVYPSAVAASLKSLIASGKINHRTSDDQLEIKKS